MEERIERLWKEDLTKENLVESIQDLRLKISETLIACRKQTTSNLMISEPEFNTG